VGEIRCFHEEGAPGYGRPGNRHCFVMDVVLDV